MATLDARGRRRLTVGILVNITVIAFEALAVTAIAPHTAQELGGSDLYGWMFAAFTLAQLVSVVVTGHASDRYGPAPVLAVGYGAFLAGLFVCGLAPTMPVLILGRALQGLGAGALFTTAYVAIGRAYAEHERPRQFALLSTAWVVPGLLAPALGGIISEQIGWRWVFLGLAALPLIAAVLALPALAQLRPTADEHTDELPIGNAVLLAVAAGVLLIGLGEGGDAAVAIPVIVAGAIPGWWAFRRLTPPGTLRAARGLPAAVAGRGLLTFTLFGADAFFAFSLSHVRGLSALEIGLALTPQTLAWTAGSWLQARRAGRWSRRSMAVGGAALVVVAVLGAATSLLDGVPLAVPIAMWSISGLGMGLAYSQTSLVALSEAAEGRQGASAAAVQMSDVLGVALGTGVGGAVIALGAANGWARPDALAVVFAIMVGSGLLACFAAGRLPADPTRSGSGRPVPAGGPTPSPEVVRSPTHGDDLS